MNLKIRIRSLLLTFAMLLTAIGVSAQSREVSGKILDNDGKTPMIGCTILVKGTTTGTVSEVDGLYKIKIPNDNAVLIFQSLGYNTQEVVVGTRTAVNITMKETAQKIDDVVVTALGLTRAEKSLGYAVSKINNDDITKSTSSNWINNMNGKVAGLSMTSAGTGPGSSMRVVLRGDASLNHGKNGALFVIDGVPVLSGGTATSSNANYASGDAPVDFGNAVSDLNPDDIENVSVLKGPSAAALYGSNGANGVIMITTKKGRTDKGWGVTYNGSVTFEKAGFFPDFQDQYGSSAVTTSLTNQYYSAWGLPASMTEDGIAVKKQSSRYAYGEKFDASKMRYLYLSKNWETGEFTQMPWVYADDWYTGLFQTGVTYTNSVSVEGSNGAGSSARFSFTDSRNDWIMPNTGYDRQTYSLSLNQKLNKHITFDAKVNYVRKQSDNMPVAGYDESSPMYGLIWSYNVNSMQAYRDEYMQGRYTYANWLAGDYANTDPYNVTSSLIYNSKGGHNPYRVLYEELNTLVRDRVYGTASLNFNLMKGLTLTLRGGMDMNNDFRTQRKPKMTADYVNGMYREQTVREYEFNIDFLLKYTRNFVNDRLSVSAAFGGNRKDHHYYTTKITATELSEEGPGMYNLSNTPINPDTYTYRSNKEVQSLYAFVNVGWDDTYYLDVTARNDYSSTLASGNWSYFYPSVSASVLLEKMLNIKNNNINMLKLRASWSNVGNDTDPYVLDDAYSSTAIPGGNLLPTTASYRYIKPENVESWEIGFEGKFLQNRFNFDVAVYQNNTTNQIISASKGFETGVTALKMNAGKVRNRGIEVSFRAIPVRTKNWTWEINGNWSRNKTVLCDLGEDWDNSSPLSTSTGTTVGSRTFIYSYVGQEMQMIYGKTYKRAPEGSTYIDENGHTVDCSGQLLINATTGYPSLTDKADQFIAKVNPDWRAGFGTTLSWKSLSMTASFTAQVGGNAYSVSNFALSYQGKLKNSLAGREDGLVLDGVILNSDGTYTKNKVITDNINDYYNGVKWVRDNTYENTFSTDFLKFKELRLDYRLPSSLVKKTKFLQSASIGFFATNIFCITSWPQYDPEAASVANGSDIVGGIETGTMPMTRTYGFNLKLQF